MPNYFPFANNDAPDSDVPEACLAIPDAGQERKRKNSVLGRIQKIGQWFKDDEERAPEDHEHLSQDTQEQESTNQADSPPSHLLNLLGRRTSRKVVPGLPRPLTFRRQQSEKRDRLLPIASTPIERRALSADRRPRTSNDRRCPSPPLTPLPSLSAPEVGTPVRHHSFNAIDGPAGNPDLDVGESAFSRYTPRRDNESADSGSMLANSRHPDDSQPPEDQDARSVLDERELQAELESKWILNLSMHFRDMSDREKFFVTYAQQRNRWRRVTVSCDYRNAEIDSLEEELKGMHYQRDKSTRIYEAIRDSLPEIQFFDTVTNLKLETENNRLHVHVTEDTNEIINYPSTSLVAHVQCKRYRESELEFDAHLSGFVYRVRVDDLVLIKKEIPGPDTIDEFLYEVNALDALQDSCHVITFHGLVVDEQHALVKGLLISFASGGSLVDMIYDFKGTDQLPIERRLQWAKEIVHGLSEIHEAGFVQGDFTLSNIVIDSDDKAKIIDINRRGCPVGWEPPELVKMIESGQRIGMCIGVKSDLFQLGMVLWALAESVDEPEQVPRIDSRLPPVSDSCTPRWFREIVETCLCERPKDRVNAKQLLDMFQPLSLSNFDDRSRLRIQPFIDPSEAVNHQDLENHRRQRATSASLVPSIEPYTSVGDDPSTNYIYRSDHSYFPTSRTPSALLRQRRRSSPLSRSPSSATSLSTDYTPAPRVPDVAYEYMCPDHATTASREEQGGASAPTFLLQEPHNRPEDDQMSRRLSSANVNTSGETTPFAVEPRTLERAGQHSGEYQTKRRDDTYLRSPPHQDSGFDELMFSGMEGTQHTTADEAGLSESADSTMLRSHLASAIMQPPPHLDVPTTSVPLQHVGGSVTPQSAPEPFAHVSNDPVSTNPQDAAGEVHAQSTRTDEV